MNRTLKSLLFGIGAFVLVGVASFFIVKSLDPIAPEPAALPPFEAPVPVIESIPFEGDASETATVFAEYQRESLEAAYAAGLPTNEAEPFIVTEAPVAGTSGSTSATSSSSSTGAGSTETTAPSSSDTSTSTIPSGSESDGFPAPAPSEPTDGEERVVDLCAESDADGCPEGVGGTVLAIKAVPELFGQTIFMPHAPATPVFAWDTRCEAIPAEEGKANFSISTNRPAVITMRYRSQEWQFGGYAFPEETQTFTTTAEQEAEWNAWLADDSATDDDPRSWIHHCVTLELPARDDYIAWVSYTAKEDSSITAVNRRRVDFYVPGPGGIEPGSSRRPTFVLPSGLDELFMGVTKEPEQRFVSAAIPGHNPAVCDIAGSEGAIGSADGAVMGVVRSETDIPTSRTQDPAYPYFPTYTVTVNSHLQLQTGTDYILCNYWLTPGPSFDVQQVVEVEAIPISTPEAYVPTVVLHGLTDIYREPTSVTVSIPHCGTRTFDLTVENGIVSDRNGARISSPYPETLCTVRSHIGEIERRGLRVDSTVQTGVGESESSSYYVRTSVECSGPCPAIRFPEMAIVPLASIASDGSECPSDPFTGCLSTDTHAAGKVIVELQFDSSDGNGAGRWSIGEAMPYDDTPAPLPVNPQMDMDVSYRFAPGGMTAGATATMEVVVDRPVDLTVMSIERLEGSEGSCDLPEPALPSRFTTVDTNTFQFSLTPLCLGSTYFVTVHAVDEDGNVGEFSGRIRGRSLGTPPDQAELFVPLAKITTEMSVAINAPDDEHGHTVYVNPATVASGDSFGTLTRTLGWTWPIGDRAAQARDGWQMFGLEGRANACGEPGARELNVHARRTSTGIPTRSVAYVGLQDIAVTFITQVHQNRTPGGPYGECAVGPLLNEYTLHRSVSLADLLEGIEITSDDGTVVWTLTATADSSLTR